MRIESVFELVAASPSTVRFDDGAELSAAQLAEDGRRVATWLGENGFAPGDRVALHLPNGVDYVRLLVGCAVGGFVAVSVNTRYSRSEADDLIARSGSRPVVLDDGWRPCEPAQFSAGADDPFVVFTTSGTTSKPKMVLHRQRSIAVHAADAARGFGYRDDDVVMVAMPLCGTFGLTSLTVALAAGARTIVTNYDTHATASLIAAEGVTIVNGSDDMFHRLLAHRANISSIRLAGYGRFNTSLDGIVDRAEAAGATLTGLYGMSEVQALLSVRDPSGDANTRQRAGGTLVSPDAAYRVVDGELQLRGPSLFAGYLAEGGASIDDELTGRHYDGDWFRTGDLAEVEDEHTFHYVARMGDALRLGGFLVSPVEIETVLVELADVEAAQVVAVDRPDGARPVAFVIAPGARSVAGLERDAIERCRARLARYKVPIRVVVVDGFPVAQSANGTKIQKVRLREMAERLLQAG